jgi:hypothetical protein
MTDEQRSGQPKGRPVAAVDIYEMASYIYRVFALQKNWSSWTVQFLSFGIECALAALYRASLKVAMAFKPCLHLLLLSGLVQNYAVMRA